MCSLFVVLACPAGRLASKVNRVGELESALVQLQKDYEARIAALASGLHQKVILYFKYFFSCYFYVCGVHTKFTRASLFCQNGLKA